MSIGLDKQSWRDHPHYLAIKWLLITFACGLVVVFGIAPFITVRTFSLKDSTKAWAHGISRAMKAYAKDRGNDYPDGYTANEAFRKLIVNGYADESLFSGHRSVYHADNKIGKPPDFAEALEPGECHWAVMRGMTLNDPGHLALIFENPVDQSWPPVWHTNLPDRNDSGWYRPRMKGHAWLGGQVVIGRNDGSIAVEPLASKEGDRVPAKDPTLFSHSPDRLLDPPFAMPEPRPSP